MKHGIRIASHNVVTGSKLYKIWADSPLFICSLGGWFLGGIRGLLFGLIISLPSSMILSVAWPRWAWDLNWTDVRLAIANLRNYGMTITGKLVFVVNKRRIVVFRNRFIASPENLGVKIPRGAWSDLLNIQDEYDLIELTHGGGKNVKMMRRSLIRKEGVRDYLYLIPKKDNELKCHKILKFLATKAGDPQLSRSRGSARGISKLAWIDHDSDDSAKSTRYNFQGNT